ncbi:hypothetical protein BU14_0027s0100 [Porphyra umbilicalis]|uniref:Uncharacterized protein n=1 Tax=Porphyra umbilicalis TaxID=2786 RepID=A0A1X6PJJ0_PORUM|nr:hypothetical protein BU14_0027s0100 [Porphyra umbilicalis]|eukprot:OSX81074.1 hypothetical protein BU14_0027s0100 [Porphyra umbilicalis]
MQATKFASFKARWVRPEVYPLAAAIGAAVGLCSYFVVHKATADPSVTWDRTARASGVEAQYAGRVADDGSVTPLWGAVKSRSIRIFDTGNPVMDAKRGGGGGSQRGTSETRGAPPGGDRRLRVGRRGGARRSVAGVAAAGAATAAAGADVRRADDEDTALLCTCAVALSLAWTRVTAAHAADGVVSGAWAVGRE